MTDYIKPSIRRKPDEIIVHVGSGDEQHQVRRAENSRREDSQAMFTNTKRMTQDEGNNFFYYRLDRMIL